MSPSPQITPAPLPFLSTPSSPNNDVENNLVPRQASIVTQTVVASTGISAPTGSSSSSSSAFPVAVAVPALIGGMALALLGAFGYWWYQRRRTREQKRRWEARQKRQNKKRGNSNATSRPSISGSRPTGGRSGLSDKEKDIGGLPGSIPPVPPLPTLSKEYGYGQPQPHAPGGQTYPGQGQGQAYGGQPQYAHDQYAQYDQYGQHPVQPGIDAYGAAPATDPFVPAEEDHVEEYKPNGPAAIALAAPVSAPKSNSRGAKRVELAESKVARDQADPMTRWRPNKPSPLALAAEQKRLEAGGASLSPTRSTGGGYGRRTSLEPPTSAGESSWEYQEELSTPNDPNYLDRRSVEGGAGRQVSGEWGVAGEVHSGASAGPQYGAGAYGNDPYLSAHAGQEDESGGYRAPSGQYSVDPYSGYHGGAAPAAGGKAKVGGWV